ncbi:MAG: AmmeMemoRadiSam system protein A [Lachnospiraceae bacterium]|nr:AmmeMemoRadiSam system protein A [Lachnospiraceae bacterium]
MSILAAFMVPHPPMIVPQIGRGSEAQIQDTIRAYEQVADEIAALKPETILITSPHATMYADYFHVSPGRNATGSFSDFGVPQITFNETYDEEIVRRIERLAGEWHVEAGSLGERDRRLDHGTMVPLWFIRQKYDAFKIVRIGLSGLSLADHYKFGMLIREVVEATGRRAVFVASGDLSHKLQEYGPYGFAAEGPQYDERIMDVCSRAAFGEMLDFDEVFCEKAAECGHRSFVIMAGALDAQAVDARVLSHEDVTGVGYGVCTFYPKGPDENRHFLDLYLKKWSGNMTEDAYVTLARKSLESYILRQETIRVPDDLPKDMLMKRAGAFVSIHKFGKLRGCIGTILPTTDSVAEEIIENAISASTRDPRFPAIEAEELPFLEINVDVLGEPEDIASTDELDVKKYGVIVSCGGRRGLLLPDLDGVDTVEEQVMIAMQKAGISPGEKISLQRFEVVRHV